jgi:hypothetical protein
MLWVLLVGMPFFSIGQEFKISSVITYSLGVSINGAIITVTKTKEASEILAYTNSNLSGNYNIIINNVSIDSVFLNVRHIAYKTIQVTMAC